MVRIALTRLHEAAGAMSSTACGSGFMVLNETM